MEIFYFILFQFFQYLMDYNKNLLHKYAYNGDLNNISKLINSNIPYNISFNNLNYILNFFYLIDDDKRTPLHWACMNGNIDVISYFLNYTEIDINNQDEVFFYIIFIEWMDCFNECIKLW